MQKNKVKFLPKHPRQVIIDDIMASSAIRLAFENLAKKNNSSIQTIHAHAKCIFKEMISAHDPKWVNASSWVVKLIQKLLFGQVELKGDLETLHTSDLPTLYIPVHRSHMDYLFLSYALFKNQLPPPIIAAGINLSFFPIGPIFRRLGAFFIRRRISGNATYKICLEHYLLWLVKNRQDLECYPEGGRSRNGMMRKPQTGLIQLILQAMATQNQPFNIVPVAIGYDFIPDDHGFIAEEMGHDKKNESIWTMLKSLAHIRNHGAVHFHVLPAITNFTVDDPNNAKASAQTLLAQVFHSIEKHMPITAIQVLSCALLTSEKEAPEEYIFEQAMAIRTTLMPYQNQFSESLKQLEHRFPKLIEQLVRKKWLIQTSPYHYNIPSKSRISMNYHRHSILHYFLPTYFGQKERPPILQKLWLDYFPILDTHWLKPLQNLDNTTVWPELENMMNNIIEPYTNSNTSTHVKTAVSHPRPENITPAKQQRAKNWLRLLDSGTLQQILNMK